MKGLEQGQVGRGLGWIRERHFAREDLEIGMAVARGGALV